ncbi:MAG: sigma-54-dependent Fis family transcriptional regulator [Mitsuaria chitosanitabida]|uniref:sigma-54-dependent transcriptional regulator n=1 Tax=Roseateles chitosanitabidus TaxID=65048 RepID=UPI001B1EAD43|nr:sigma-54 dependent transcriptional regulator [Roseateles chitosanitabidus]MBO9689233.1 sigma-54-dependent Fis family transcriptional regulator [Roseateles chitosanitabidus]
MSADPRLLVVDDEPDLRTLYEMTLLREGYTLDSAGTVEDALELLGARRYDAVITDMRLPDGSGLDILRWLEQQGRGERALVITAYGSAENAVEALKAGAYDYLTKPVDLRQFRMVVASALGRAPKSEESAPRAFASAIAAAPVPSSSAGAAATPAPITPRAASAEPRKPAVEKRAPASAEARAAGTSSALDRLVGDSAAMRQVRELIGKVARSMAPVLLHGESGTGKELVARAIHDVSARRPQPFIAVNCGAIPEQLLEAEFFGYRKGAFTGASEDREGFFQASHNGTLFLDEIGDLPLAMQSKLLRALQERSVRPVGAVAEMPVNVRLLSATHKDLAAEVAAGRFRQDLYYRLNVIQIRVPPLRERMEDLTPISTRILERIAADAGVSPVPRLTASAQSTLSRYSFPGNVRELENLLHRALALSSGDSIDLADLGLPDSVLGTDAASGESAFTALDAAPGAGAEAAPDAHLPPELRDGSPLPRDLATYLDEVERRILLRALEHYRNNRTAAGASLGLSLRQMRYRMARLAISIGGDEA